MSEIPDNIRKPFVDLLLAAADDKLILGHRNSDWTGLGPILEEDIAFSSFAQDDIAHAQALYDIISEIDDRTPDQLAFGRSPDEYRCAVIVEQPDQFNWAVAISRMFICNHYNLLRYDRFAASKYDPLAQLASRLKSEQQIAIEHVDDWVVRLGQGTDESRSKMQAALTHLQEQAGMLHEPVEQQELLVDSGWYPPLNEDMFDKWVGRLTATIEKAGLQLAIHRPEPNVAGGRRGTHSEFLKNTLEEMSEVFRTDPDAAW